MAEPIKVDFKSNAKKGSGTGGGSTKEVVIPPDKAGLKIALSLIIAVVGGAIAYYFMLPPLNFRSVDFYIFCGIIAFLYVAAHFVLSKAFIRPEFVPYVRRRARVPIIIAAALLLTLGVGYLTSCVVFRAHSFSKLLELTDQDSLDSSVTVIDSTEDFKNVPMVDAAASEKLADKVLGDLASLNLESQFDIATAFSTQINYKGAPCRVYPLKYGNIFKWLSNTSDGFPGYVIVNMNTQDATFFFLDREGTDGYLKYSPTEHFHKHLKRIVRFANPTMLIGNISFEIDEEGTPYWIVESLKKRVGLIAGDDVKGIVLVNAITGEQNFYDAEELKAGTANDGTSLVWIDQVYDADLLIKQYNYYGTYINGFWNSLFSQTGVKKTTTGASYLAMDEDVYIYTGVTSVTSDQSILGFVLINQRTKEALFYNTTGTTEAAAMESAEGAVSDKHWNATFPLLINLDGEATYFMALKDDTNVVKGYAMVNVGNYNLVATDAADGNPDLVKCIQNYISVIRANKSKTLVVDTSVPLPEKEDEGESADLPEQLTVSGAVTEVLSQTENGSTYYYVKTDASDAYYRISASDFPQAIFAGVGTSVTISYTEAGAAQYWTDATGITIGE